MTTRNCLGKRKDTTNYSMLHYLDGAPQSGEAHHYTSAKSHYMQIYFECLDVIIESIETCFNQPSYLAYGNLENLLIKAIAGKDFTSEKNYVLETYKDDIDMDQFEKEVHLLKLIFEGVVVSCFDEILTKLKSLSQHEISLLNNTAAIVELILINPSTTATAERSFSGHRCLKGIVAF